jgi:hypothetical protein
MPGNSLFTLQCLPVGLQAYQTADSRHPAFQMVDSLPAAYQTEVCRSSACPKEVYRLPAGLTGLCCSPEYPPVPQAQYPRLHCPFRQGDYQGSLRVYLPAVLSLLPGECPPIGRKMNSPPFPAHTLLKALQPRGLRMPLPIQEYFSSWVLPASSPVAVSGTYNCLTSITQYTICFAICNVLFTFGGSMYINRIKSFRGRCPHSSGFT